MLCFAAHSSVLLLLLLLLLPLPHLLYRIKKWIWIWQKAGSFVGNKEHVGRCTVSWEQCWGPMFLKQLKAGNQACSWLLYQHFLPLARQCSLLLMSSFLNPEEVSQRSDGVWSILRENACCFFLTLYWKNWMFSEWCSLSSLVGEAFCYCLQLIQNMPNG